MEPENKERANESCSDDLPAGGAKSRPRRNRWKRLLCLGLAGLVVVGLLFLWCARNHIRTLASLRRVEGTNVYVMDYYANYHMDEIRRDGMDVRNMEKSYIKALFPDVIVPIANSLRSSYVPDRVQTVPSRDHHCSTIAWTNKQGESFFGRNFDAPNDALLLLRVHGPTGMESVALIDLAYLNLNRSDLTETSLIKRIPLLFSPYYVMDGMNKYGLAVSAMTVPEAAAPTEKDVPDVTQATLLRLMIDYCETVDDAIRLVGNYNISFAKNPEHLMVADALGNKAVIEFVDGKTRVIRPTNQSLTCTNHNLWEKTEAINDQLCDRYKTGSAAIALVPESDRGSGFENAARSMAVPNWTMWTSVYNLNERKIRVMYKSNPETLYTDYSLSN